MFNYPDVTGSVPAPSAARRRGDKLNPDITGAPAASPTEPGGPASVEAKVDPKPAAAKDGKDAKPPGGTVIPVDPAHPVSGAERAILERLQQRRQELDARARELDIRESLIKAAEKRLEKRLNELKETEGRITTAMEKKEEAEAARLKGLVTMYENMKPRDAAKVFDRLDIRILLEVATQINPRRMSDILAQMSPDAAERLTVEIANRSKEADQSRPPELPKIEGQPTEP
jgi:flagellar motility protein MotE (MotC chaperone)